MNRKKISKNLGEIKQKYSRVLHQLVAHTLSHPRLAIALVACVIILLSGFVWIAYGFSTNKFSEQIAMVSDTSETSVEESTTTETETSENLATKISSLGQKFGLTASPTPTPTTQTSDTESKNTGGETNQATNTPTPSTTTTSSTQPSATPSPTATTTPAQPTPTQVIPTATATPIPTNTPTPGPVQSNASITLTSASGATPNAFGTVNFNITHNTNGYWDFVTSGTFHMLQPNRPYQLWICSQGCSSHVNARFTTDSAGTGSISSATITYPQGLYPAQTVRINELVDVPPGVVIPTDSTRCYQMTGMTPCLQSSVSF